jgi:16S rRNA (uracil1498-N3)-methyltransferase
MEHTSHFLFFALPPVNGMIMLDSDESRHAAGVLRYTVGDTIAIADGTGVIRQCTISQMNKKSLSAKVIKEVPFSGPQTEIRVFAGLPERPSFDSMLENIVPLGILRISPVICRFCQKRWWDDWDKQKERLERKMIACCKQALLPRVPIIDAPIVFEKALKEDPSTTTWVIADEEGMSNGLLRNAIQSQSVVHCFIGPPGGFSPEEIASFNSLNTIKVRLSDYRLRTELAAAMLVGAVKQVGYW